MRLIDTHCHLYLEDFDPEQDELAQKAKDSGIDTLLLPNVDLTTIDRMHDLCDRYPEFAFPMMGLHPTSVDSNYIDILKQTESYLSKRTYCGIGEIGIDLYWDKTYLKEQQNRFRGTTALEHRSEPARSHPYPATHIRKFWNAYISRSGKT